MQERVLFTFFGFRVFVYGFMTGLGLLLGTAAALREAKRRGIGSLRMFDAIIAVAAAFLLVGGIFGNGAEHGFGLLIRPWLIVLGGRINVTAGLWAAAGVGVWFVYRNRLLPLDFLDAIMPSAALFQSLAHLGSSDLGRMTEVAWAVPVGNFGLHPLPLYAAVGYYCIFCLLWRRRRQTGFLGELVLGYLILSSWLKLILSFFQDVGGVSTSPWVYAVVAIMGMVLWLIQLDRVPAAPAYRRYPAPQDVGLSVGFFLGVILLMSAFFYSRFT